MVEVVTGAQRTLEFHPRNHLVPPASTSLGSDAGPVRVDEERATEGIRPCLCSGRGSATGAPVSEPRAREERVGCRHDGSSDAIGVPCRLSRSGCLFTYLLVHSSLVGARICGPDTGGTG